MPDGTVRLSDIEPARLQQGVAVAVPDSDLEATLDEYRYGRGVRDDGTPTVIKWAEIRFSAPDHEDVGGRYPLDETYRIHGQRCYLTGSRSEILVYALPELPDTTDERHHEPL